MWGKHLVKTSTSLARSTAFHASAKSRFFQRQKSSLSKSPELPILRKCVEQLTGHIDLSRTAFFGVQHMLANTASLFHSLIALGAKPENFFFSGKFYSDHKPTIKSLQDDGMTVWAGSAPEQPGQYSQEVRQQMQELGQKLISRIAKTPEIDSLIVVDEGGYSVTALPVGAVLRQTKGRAIAFAGVEQTASGLFHTAHANAVFPLVNVAETAAKKKLERRLIAEALLPKIVKGFEGLNPEQQAICGIIGNGDIGKALVEYLLEKNFTVYVYDQDPNAFENINRDGCIRLNRIDSVIAQSQYIFGCTGKDITKELGDGIVDNEFIGDKHFFSCSSQDIEFRRWITTLPQKLPCQRSSPLSDLSITLPGNRKFVFYRSGTPATFDNGPISVSNNDIQLTRALMLMGIIQAFLQKKPFVADGKTINGSNIYMLDPELQRFVAAAWLAEHHKGRYSPELMANFDDLEWIKANSKGEVSSEHLSKILTPATYSPSMAHRPC